MTFVSAHIQANIMTAFAPSRKAVLAGRLPGATSASSTRRPPGISTTIQGGGIFLGLVIGSKESRQLAGANWRPIYAGRNGGGARTGQPRWHRQWGAVVRGCAILTLANAGWIDHNQSKVCINKQQSNKDCDTFDNEKRGARPDCKKALHHAPSHQIERKSCGEPVESVYQLSARR